jgi:general secretion pathway protein B
MSFILDALRKSETERQRGAVPGISQVPFAAPRQTLPKWAVGVIGALGLAVLALGAAWWSTSREQPPRAATADLLPRATITAPIAVPPPAPRSAPLPLPSPITAPPADPAPAEPTPALASSAEPTRPISQSATSQSVAAPSADVGTAVQARPAAPRETPSTARTAVPTQTLPSAAALAAEGIALPKLTLELHVFYRDRPGDRLVIVNGRRYREGDALAEGPRVDAIDAVGAVLSYQGRRFLLTSE